MSPGSLCENNDLVSSLTGTCPGSTEGTCSSSTTPARTGFAMGFNYNGKLRSAELLLKTDGSVQQIRRAETLDD